MTETGLAIDIGSRLELFVDDFLIDRLHGADRRLHSPAPQPEVVAFDRPWEGSSSSYFTIFQDGDIFRMYYRGHADLYEQGKERTFTRPYVCYAESEDGFSWTKPSLGLVEVEGSTDNNIIWDGIGKDTGNDFVPFKDANPNVDPQAQYKAIAVVPLIGQSPTDGHAAAGILPMKSPDGIHWTRMAEQPVITKGTFDSHNVAFWDTLRGEYRVYHRDFRPGRDVRGDHTGRDIRTSTSKDFLNWSDPVWIKYSPGRINQLYTSGLTQYDRAPHIFLGFPVRYVDRGWTQSTEKLPQLDYRRTRGSFSAREGTAVTDGMFMSSRDGLNFNIWPESFIRPGLRLKENWFYGDNYQNLGIIETESAIFGAPKEFSFYFTEASHQPGAAKRLRRHTLRIDGFVSLHANLTGGEALTKPLIFEGRELVLNFSSSAAGDIRVEVQDVVGHPIEGFSLDDCHEVWGDDLERAVSWEGAPDLSALAGQPIRLRFVIKDADLYSMRFR